MSDIDTRLESIEQRNARVEFDKAWETSWVRRGTIAGITYVCAVTLLILLGHDGVLRNALVPVMGYLLSTLSLPPLKKWWLEKQQRKA